MTVALYCRVSTDEQAQQGFSIDHQRERLIAYCHSQGWDDYRLYIDDGYTGTNLDRPELTRMLQHIDGGRIQTVVVYKLDRLSRKQKDALYLLEDVFDKRECTFKSATEPFDTSTPLGKAMLGILAVFAQLERDTIIERTTSGRRTRIRRGLWYGGRTPFGYRWDKEKQQLVIVPEHAEIIRQIYKQYLQGKSLSELADWFRMRVSDIKLDHKGISQLLGRIVYTGRLSTGTQETVEGRHEAIISSELYEMIQNERARRSNGSTPSGTYLLSGLCRCGVCGGAVVRVHMRARGYSYNYYVCKDQHVRRRERKGLGYCKSGYQRQEPLEQKIIDIVRHTALNLEDFRDELSKPSIEHLDASAAHANIGRQLTALDTKLNRWYDAFEEGTLNASQLKERIRSLEEERNKLRLLLDEAADVLQPPQTDKLFDLLRLVDQAWDVMEFDERQAVLRTAISKIVLCPGQEPELIWNV